MERNQGQSWTPARYLCPWFQLDFYRHLPCWKCAVSNMWYVYFKFQVQMWVMRFCKIMCLWESGWHCSVVLLFFLRLFVCLFVLWIWVFLPSCTTDVLHELSSDRGSRKRELDRWNWSYTQMVDTQMAVSHRVATGIKPVSYGRAASVPNQWAISLVSSFVLCGLHRCSHYSSVGILTC